MSKRDYYDILGLSRSASKDDIKKNYRKLAMRYHPDKNPGDTTAETKFKEASEAAEVLLNDQKRQAYDQFGHAGVSASGGRHGGAGGFSQDFPDLGDIFGDLFGDFMGRGRSRRRGHSGGAPGNDLEMPLDISFEEAAFGKEKELSLPRYTSCRPCGGTGGKDGARPINCDMCRGHGEIRRQQGFFTVTAPCSKCHGTGHMVSVPCPSCHGRGRLKKTVNLSVKVPAGIDTDQRLKLSGEGDAGEMNGPHGDLFVRIRVREHSIFERDGEDVHCTVPVSFSQAALGAQVEVPTLTGKVSVNIPRGVQSGKKMRLKSKGIERLSASGYGDQIVTIHVETPTDLSKRQRDIFEELARLDGHQASHPMSKGFLDKVRELFQ